ncbi:MAG TPA: DNA-binding protein, partial [Acidimicrobiia bacterium]|nr:DNA-binding protein [Acidimicrobiia bacterium]
VVLVVILISKFTAGAWIPAVVIPLVVVTCKMIKRHYSSVDQALAVPEHVTLPTIHNTVIVPINSVNKCAIEALAYARALHPDRLVAMVVDLEDTDVDALRQRWHELDLGITLDVVESPYRDITRPILKFINEIDARHQGDVITVVLPEVVVHHWWEQLLHNQTALALKGRLLFRPNTIVVSVPTQIP